MSSPYDAPATTPRPPGTLDVGLALSDGFDAMKRNFLTWLLLGISTWVAMIVLQCSVVGIVAVPALLWGVYKHSLEALDGEPELAVAWSGFQDFVPRTVSIVGAIAIQMAAMIPGYVAMFAVMGAAIGVQVVAAPDAEVPVFVLLGYLIAFPVLFVSLYPLFRLNMNLYWVVDQGMGAVEASRAAWEATRGNMLKIFGLLFAIVLLVLIGELMFFVGVIPAMMIQLGAMASAYRQLAGLRAAE